MMGDAISIHDFIEGISLPISPLGRGLIEQNSEAKKKDVKVLNHILN
jgi:hypothetical protein